MADRSPPDDVFLSYRHARYRAEAIELRDLLRRRGLVVWFDEEVDDWHITEEQIRDRLDEAISTARRVVFLETVHELVAVMLAGGGGTWSFPRGCWQHWERDAAHPSKYIVVYLSTRRLTDGLSLTSVHNYADLPDAADRIARLLDVS